VDYASCEAALDSVRLCGSAGCLAHPRGAWCIGRRRGEEVAIQDGRPNGELLLATGTLEDDNPADCLSVQARPQPWQRSGPACCQAGTGCCCVRKQA
jgi:hypothetical protein